MEHAGPGAEQRRVTKVHKGPGAARAAANTLTLTNTIRVIYSDGVSVAEHLLRPLAVCRRRVSVDRIGAAEGRPTTDDGGR